ncbi:hypothetical protein Pelo_591 [Pelomyxa schiedti]|nr:hypothetical protein Pelo_591 [Pelomyxa schiedti]
MDVGGSRDVVGVGITAERRREAERVLWVSHTMWSVVLPTVIRLRYYGSGASSSSSSSSATLPNNTSSLRSLWPSSKFSWPGGERDAPAARSYGRDFVGVDVGMIGVIVSLGEALFPLAYLVGPLLRQLYSTAYLEIGKICANTCALSVARHVFCKDRTSQFSIYTTGPQMFEVAFTNYLNSRDELSRGKCFDFSNWVVSEAYLNSGSPSICVQRAFHLCCQLGDKDSILWFLDKLSNQITPVCATDAFRILCENGRQELLLLLDQQVHTDKHRIVVQRVLECTCRKHQCHTARWLIEKYAFSSGEVRTEDNIVFKSFAEAGDLETAKWFTKTFSLDSMDVSTGNNYAFYESCERGHIDFAMWLYGNFKLPSVSFIVPSLFRNACNNGWLEMAKFLHGISKLTIKQIRENPGMPIFAILCSKGFLPFAQWLKQTFSLTISDVRFDNYLPLASAVGNNHIEVASWIVSAFRLGSSDISSVLLHWCTTGNVAGVQWLCTTFPPASTTRIPSSKIKEAHHIATARRQLIIADILTDYINKA